jgi:hypothetical protein
LEEIRRAYEAGGAEVSGDLEYLAVQPLNGGRRFYINVCRTEDHLSPWQFFDDQERFAVREIVGEPKWLLTIISGPLEVLNEAVIGFPTSKPAALHNDWGLVLPLEVAQQRASAGIEWLEAKP